MNRLFDIAHSRYRPGLTFRYRELEKLQKTVTEVKHIRESIYMVFETVEDIGELDYTVDMELCTCSCSVGQTGAACKHQAAIAKRYNISSLNLIPISCKVTRQLYATIARENSYVMDAEFYADLNDTRVNTRKVERKVLTPQHDRNNVQTSDVQAESIISMSVEHEGDLW